MAVTNQLNTIFGEIRSLYVRLNNIEQQAGRQPDGSFVKAAARFRGYNSLVAFNGAGPFMWERVVEFDADNNETLWPQAYAALKREEEFAEAEDA